MPSGKTTKSPASTWWNLWWLGDPPFWQPPQGGTCQSGHTTWTHLLIAASIFFIAWTWNICNMDFEQFWGFMNENYVNRNILWLEFRTSTARENWLCPSKHGDWKKGCAKQRGVSNYHSVSFKVTNMGVDNRPINTWEINLNQWLCHWSYPLVISHCHGTWPIYRCFLMIYLLKNGDSP